MNEFSPFQHRGSLPCNVCLHEQVARVDAWLVQGISPRESAGRNSPALLYNVIVFVVT